MYWQNILGRSRKRKTTLPVDKIIRRKVKVDRRKSASSVRQEIEHELDVIIIQSNSLSSSS